MYKKEFEKGKTPYKISYESEIQGIELKATLSYQMEWERDKIFEKIDEESAKKNLGALKTIIH